MPFYSQPWFKEGAKQVDRRGSRAAADLHGGPAGDALAHDRQCARPPPRAAQSVTSPGIA